MGVKVGLGRSNGVEVFFHCSAVGQLLSTQHELGDKAQSLCGDEKRAAGVRCGWLEQKAGVGGWSRKHEHCACMGHQCQSHFFAFCAFVEPLSGPADHGREIHKGLVFFCFQSGSNGNFGQFQSLHEMTTVRKMLLHDKLHVDHGRDSQRMFCFLFSICIKRELWAIQKVA